MTRAQMAYPIRTEVGTLPPSLTDSLGDWTKYQELIIKNYLERTCKFHTLSCDTSFFTCPSCTARSIQELTDSKLQCPHCETWFSKLAMELLKTNPLQKLTEEQRVHHERISIASRLKRRADDLLIGHLPDSLDKIAARYF